MAIVSFIPAIWSAKLLLNLHKNLVFANLINTDYEGEISGAGDRVKINEIGPINIGNYTKNSDISFQELTDAQKELIIDQLKYFAFQVDDVDKAQTKPKIMDGAMQEAAYGLKDAADQYVAGLYGGAGITSDLGTNASPLEIQSGDVVEVVALIAQKMDENNVPTEGRWMVIPPWFHNKMVLAKISSDKLNSEVLLNGRIGRFLGFDFSVSNNLDVDGTADGTKILAGIKPSISFAGQIVQTEALRLEKRFADAVKGLYVYGAKVVRPSTLACLTAKSKAES